jgi:hypothetical protein
MIKATAAIEAANRIGQGLCGEGSTAEVAAALNIPGKTKSRGIN